MQILEKLMGVKPIKGQVSLNVLIIMHNLFLCYLQQRKYHLVFLFRDSLIDMGDKHRFVVDTLKKLYAYAEVHHRI